MAVRDFKTASSQFLETVSTFTSYELMDYVEFVKYAVIAAMLDLPRNEVREKIMKGAEIQEVLHSPNQKLLSSFVMSLYDCKYAQFFKDLAEIESVWPRHSSRPP
jgi:26S proteasome regulatory subunit N7